MTLRKHEDIISLGYTISHNKNREEQKKMKKQVNSGITLISLVITIIILIILAGVIMYMLGEQGIIKRAEQAGKEYKQAGVNESKDLEELYSQMMIATNDSSKITISVEDLKTFIQTQVQEEIGKQSNMKVLWENPNKTAGFSEQVISWGGENPSEGTKDGAETYEYNYLLIEYSEGSEIISKGEQAQLMKFYEDPTANSYYISQRTVNTVDDISLQFSNTKNIQLLIGGGYKKYLNWENNCIPTKIIGIK